MIGKIVALLCFLQVSCALQRSLDFRQPQTTLFASNTTEVTKLDEFLNIKSMMQCSHLCTLDEACVSFLYKQDGLCQLHNATCSNIPGGYAATTLCYQASQRGKYISQRELYNEYIITDFQ